MAPSSKDRNKSSLKDNPSALGDPVSLKSETSDSDPTGQDGAIQTRGETYQEKFKKMVKSNPSMLGDPVSLKAETSDRDPTEGDRGEGTKSKKRDSKI